MREIKFRAWNKETKKICESDSLEGWLRTEHNNGIAAGMLKMPQIPEWEELYEHLIFMQYTGLKDRNGKEIFEGDILKFTNLPAKPFEVVWNKEEAGFIRWYPKDEVIIIGNIYENPELLKEIK